MARVNTCGLTDECMLAHGSLVNLMDMVSTRGQMAKAIRVTSRTTDLMDKVK